ncbi:hypothetical protein F511_31963 [Dorcoceras hygrometricum]|uniref:Uncharacterized protein n=1 Tax=Dorcoceras hygrometricum TaxID=472368 RepID=A0A2Z7D5P6_9LAMI|nr:hypothetical protein F511_31963 [Dorcoceras hygrometricum]
MLSMEDAGMVRNCGRASVFLAGNRTVSFWKKPYLSSSVLVFSRVDQCGSEISDLHISDLVARDFVCGNYSSELRMLVLEDERVTPVYLISLLGSVSHYERSGCVVHQSNAIIGAVTTGYECLPPSCDGLTGPDDHGPMISRLIDRVRHTVAAGVHLLKLGVHLERGSVTFLLVEPSEEEEGEIRSNNQSQQESSRNKNPFGTLRNQNDVVTTNLNDIVTYNHTSTERKPAAGHSNNPTTDFATLFKTASYQDSGFIS